MQKVALIVGLRNMPIGITVLGADDHLVGLTIPQGATL